MRIGFDLLPYFPAHHGGAEVFFRSIYQAVPAIAPDVQTVLFGCPETLTAYSTGRASETLVPVRASRSRVLRFVQQQLRLPHLALSHRVSVLVCNYVIPLFTPTATVAIVHDLLFRRYPESIEATKRLMWSVMLPATLRRATVIATVSQFSAREISALYPHTVGRVFVTVEGVRSSLLSATVPASPVPPPFLLCPATFGAHKNLLFLVRAFSRILRDQPSLRLVLVGTPRTPDAHQYHRLVCRAIAEAGVQTNVDLLGHVPDTTLAALYARASACVLPSLYEGYGLPVVEAQAIGCPVVCSDRGALPETAGGACRLFDPTSDASLRDALLPLLLDEGMRRALVVAGKLNARRHTWEAAAGLLIDAIYTAGRASKRSADPR